MTIEACKSVRSFDGRSSGTRLVLSMHSHPRIAFDLVTASALQLFARVKLSIVSSARKELNFSTLMHAPKRQEKRIVSCTLSFRTTPRKRRTFRLTLRSNSESGDMKRSSLVLFVERPSARRGPGIGSVDRNVRSKCRCSCVLQFTS